MSNKTLSPLKLTASAVNKIKKLIANEKNLALKLRIYISGGGCSGFQYGFMLDDKINHEDVTFEKHGIKLVVDPMSLQYLIGGVIDYSEELEGSHFIVKNPNAKITCGCGLSFST